MSPRPRPGRRILRAFLPVALLVGVSAAGVVVWLFLSVTSPPRHPYIVTPSTFTLSTKAFKATDETWANRDGTQARGWLLRGAEGAPAVILFHQYGADRSWLLNLGVKLNEATNFTILWPDLRGHGPDPPVGRSSLGAREAEDVLAAIEYLRALKSAQGSALAGERIGIYGVEMGAYAGLVAASHAPEGGGVLRALALDSVPESPDATLRSALRTRTGLDNELFQLLARVGMRAYVPLGYRDRASCEAARRITSANVLLLAGSDARDLRESTSALARCFPDASKVEVQVDLPLTGTKAAFATGEEGEAYDRRVIEFFDRTLAAAP